MQVLALVDSPASFLLHQAPLTTVEAPSCPLPSHINSEAFVDAAKAVGRYVKLGGQRGSLDRMQEMARRGNAASAAVRRAASAKRNEDLMPVIEDIRAAGAVTPRQIADGLNEWGNYRCSRWGVVSGPGASNPEDFNKSKIGRTRRYRQPQRYCCLGISDTRYPMLPARRLALRRLWVGSLTSSETAEPTVSRTLRRASSLKSCGGSGIKASGTCTATMTPRYRIGRTYA